MSFLKSICIAILTFLSTAVYADAVVWQNLAPGMDYTRISLNQTNAARIEAFRIDPSRYKITLATAHEQGMNSANIGTLAMQNKALLAINGGFFDPTHVPLGLRIKDGKQLNPLRSISWWGVFYTVNNKAYIVSQRDFATNQSIDFAIQTGPRLIVNGQIPKLKENYDARSALAIDRQGKIIVAITDNTAISTTEFAKILQAPLSQGGLNCYNALNLDGGSSSQLFANIDGFHLIIPSFAYISDAVIVVQR